MTFKANDSSRQYHRFEMEQGIENGTQPLPHFDRKFSPKAVREHVSRQFAERGGGHHFCRFKVGEINTLVIHERSTIAGVGEKYGHELYYVLPSPLSEH